MSAFLWGFVFGGAVRFTGQKMFSQPFLQDPWRIVSSAFAFGTIFSFFDWYRRLCLTTLCVQEERRAYLKKYHSLNAITAGSEYFLKDEFIDVAVNDYQY
ncbi:hypothetical protein pb186bvf_013452 [Paramecium bursaria]